MLIFCSILLVSVAFIISSRVYKKVYPDMKLNSVEVVLIPFRFDIDMKTSPQTHRAWLLLHSL